MRIVIAGAGSVGLSIAQEMLKLAYEVTLTDSNPEAMKVSSVAEANWILEDLSSPDVMERAGEPGADVVVAATGDDRANLVISLLAKTQYGVPLVIARVNNVNNEKMFGESWGVDVPISTPRMMASLVEEAVTVGNLVPVFRFYNSHSSLHSVVLDADSPLIGKQVGDTEWPENTLLSALMRDGDAHQPQPSLTFQARDQLLFLISGDNQDTETRLRELVCAAPGIETGVEEGTAAGAAQQQPAEIENQRE